MSADDDNPQPDLDALDDEMRRIEHDLERAEGLGREDATKRLRRLRRRAAEVAPDALFGPVQEDGIRGIARRTDSYGFVLIMLAALIWLFLPVSTERSWARVPTIAVFFLTIIIAMHTSFVRESRLKAVVALDLALLLVGILGFALDNDDVRAVTDVGFAALLFVTAGVVLVRVLRHNAVTSRTISGAVAAYLFVGLGFASLANGINLVWPGAYATPDGVIDFSSMTYFSFVTLATLGYGDIVPVSDWARSMATLEAVLGQIYLVTIVARLVALFGTVRRTPDVADTDPT
jgi:hypothetical protein